MTDRPDPTITDNPERSRFEAILDGAVVGVADYRVLPDRIVFTHTEVDDDIRGQGVGSRLAAGALDLVQARGQRVEARCSFIRSYVERHPDYADLLHPAA